MSVLPFPHANSSYLDVGDMPLSLDPLLLCHINLPLTSDGAHNEASHTPHQIRQHHALMPSHLLRQAPLRHPSATTTAGTHASDLDDGGEFKDIKDYH
jgi:hypothetical protein